MLVNTKEIVLKAMMQNYAVPQFNINNLEWIKFILLECEENKSPVILGVSESSLKYMMGAKNVVDMVKNTISYLNITVPVAIHLDHAKSFDICKVAIDEGFTSVMIDASYCNLYKNIDITNKVVTYSKNHKVSVEGEIGQVGKEDSSGTHDVELANVNDCIKYVESTKIDLLAPSLGSVHGFYKEEANIDFDSMKILSTKLNIPLVLHGGSGLEEEKIRKAINYGVSKINFNTELQVSWAKGVKEYLNNNNEYDPRKVISSGGIGLRNCVRDKIMLLKSNGKG